MVWVLPWEVGCNGRRMALKSVGADNFGIHGNQSVLSNSFNHNKTNTTVSGIVRGAQWCDVYGERMSVTARFLL